MAFNKAPSQSTYQTRDVKLIAPPDNRNKTLNTDFMALNGFYDVIQDRASKTEEYQFVKRDGTAAYPYTIPSVTIRGMYFWEDQDKLFVAYDDKIAIITASTGSLVTTVTPFVTTTGDVGFTEFYYDTGDTKLVVSDGSKLITIDSSNTVVTGSDVDMPTPHSPHILFLDGYLFMVKSGTSDIYNSDLNDPLAYTSGDFITAEMSPDTLIRIAKLNNYIVAFGSASIEYFYDAANASGSPLNRNDTPVKQVGFLGGLAHYANRIYFVGQTSTTDPDVYVLENLQIDQANSPALRRYMQPNTSFYGALVSCGGHDFYCLTAVNGTPLETWWLDLKTSLWTRQAFRATSSFPVKFAGTLPRTGTGNTSVMVLDGSAELYHFGPTVYQDGGVNFTSTVRTTPEHFDTLHEKYMSRVMVAADRPSSSASVSIRVSDDDYQTWSTARTVELNQEMPYLNRWGRFRKRIFELSLTANVPFRVHHLEVDFNIGNR